MAKKKRKVELTPEQKAHQAKKRAKFKAQEEEVLRLPTTFGLVTAERLLAKIGVSLSQAEISMQIQNPKTFYHALLYLPAKRTKLRGGIERCRDIQAYGQQKLIHYLFSGEASKEETENGQEVREEIEASRQRMVEMGKTFLVWEEDCLEKTTAISDDFKERAKAWTRTVILVVNDLKKCFKQHGITVDKACYKSIIAHLSECCARLSITKEQERVYKAPIGMTRVELAVICELDEKGFSELLSAEKLKLMRDEFKRLDALLQAEYDGLNGFNNEQKSFMDSDLKQIDAFFGDFEKEVIHIAQILFKYFNEYASDADLKVDISEALEFGVDEAVADDYRALQI
jgi:hypothetical protein